MKTLRLSFIALVGCLGMLSCSDDDSDSNTQIPDLDPVGTFNLSSANLTEEIDFNQDGTASSNLMDESGCYVGSYITINSDGTFTSLYNSADFSTETGCGSQEGFGTWASAGNIVTLTDTSVTVPLEMTYTISDDETAITTIFANTPYPDRDENGEPVYTTGAVTFVFTKQQ